MAATRMNDEIDPTAQLFCPGLKALGLIKGHESIPITVKDQSWGQPVGDMIDG